MGQPNTQPEVLVSHERYRRGVYQVVAEVPGRARLVALGVGEADLEATGQRLAARLLRALDGVGGPFDA